jgi:carbon monoxide dehydrogenase subunit G
MATVVKTVRTSASPQQAWAAIADIGALHTRLVPGFVMATKLVPGARIVTFANGMTVREPIVTLDEAARRLVWSAEGGRTSHYNASAQVFAEPTGGTRVVWTADFLPDDAAPDIDVMMAAGATAMQKALDSQTGDLGQDGISPPFGP